MDLGSKLIEQGWHLTETGRKKLIADAGAEDVKKIINLALDWDFRDIAGGALPTPSKRNATADDSLTIPGRIVLQVTKVRNISAPKSNEDSKAAPRFLQLELTDGVTSLQALELERIESLSLNVPPGTKIHFRAERLQLMQGFVVLRDAELKVLGGRVEELVEKWELARSMQKYAKSGRRMSGASGPPPWIAFGKKTDALNETPLANQRNFKSLQAPGGGAAAGDKDCKENEEFNAMRTEAIAFATKAGAKKIFGGGTQQILDHNVKKILEKGYTEEDAKNALRSTNNNLERALYNLKRRFDHKRYDDGEEAATAAPSSGFRRGSGAPREMGKRGAASLKDEANAAKPATNVSLFDFLTDKLPANTETTTTAAPSAAPTRATHSAVPRATQSAALPSTAASSSTYRNPFHAPTPQRFDKSKSDVGAAKSHYNNNNSSSNKTTRDAAAAAADASQTKFENNISSSFAANRPRGGAGGRGRGGGGGGGSEERGRERENFSHEERTGGNSRYSGSSRGGGGRGGGGGGGRGSASSTYQSGSRQNYEEPNNKREGGGGGGGEKGVARHSNPFKSGSSRTAHERSSVVAAPPPPSGGAVASASASQAEGGGAAHENRRGNEKSERYGNFSEGHKGSGGGGGGYEKNRSNQRENNAKNYNGANQRQQNNYNNNNAGAAATTNAATTTASSSNNANNNDKINKLVEATSKMKIVENETKQNSSGGGGARQQQQRGQQQQHRQQHPNQSQQQQQQQYSQVQAPPQSPQTQPAQPNPVYMSQLLGSGGGNTNNNNNPFSGQQLPNGFTYDPSKIIGFQNKKTNEFAMTLLKSQGVAATGGNNAAVQQQQQQQQLQQSSPYSNASGGAAFLLPSPTAAAAPQQTQQQQFGMVAGECGWLWKCGDLCLAKYWDDSRYYEAEITAVSDKTCVLCFLGYGNYEEVLKSDCLPITDAQHRPINNYQAPMPPQQQQVVAQQAPPPQHLQQQQQMLHLPPPPQQQAFQRGTAGGGGSQRYRGTPQHVYVPPAARRDN